MKIILIALFLFLSVAVCFGQTQADMDKTAYNDYHKADRELNSVYQQIIKEYSADTAFIRNIKAAQRAWVVFRDAEAKAKYPDRPGDGYYGSDQPVCWAMYMTSLTDDRTKELKVWLTGDDDEECGGSVRTK